MNVNKIFAKKPMWLRKYISLIVPLRMNFFVILHITYVDMEFIEVRYKVYIQAHRDYANIWGEKMFCAFNAINLFKFLILQSNDSLIEKGGF